MFIKYYKKICFVVILSILTNCGIDGLPLSPSQKPEVDNFDVLIPVGNQKENISKDNKENEVKILGIGELDMLGADYNANFGLENDDLEDAFRRVTPAAGQPRQSRAIIPLEHNIED